MNLVCCPYVSVETNACSWLMLTISPSLAADILKAADIVAATRGRLEKEANFVVGYRGIMASYDAVRLALFDDDRLGDSEDADDLRDRWRRAPDDFQPHPDDETVFAGASVRFSENAVVFIFEPEHYQGTSESIEITHEELMAVARGDCPFEAVRLVEASEV